MPEGGARQIEDDNREDEQCGIENDCQRKERYNEIGTKRRNARQTKGQHFDDTDSQQQQSLHYHQ